MMEPQIHGAALDYYLGLLQGNRHFSESRLAQDPDFFSRTAKRQSPKVLYIGCSDSRVTADVITSTDPGHIFSHRNVANLVVHSDMNVLSAIHFAVCNLEVEHIVVCGHYGCGGVAAAMGRRTHGLIDNWLRHIRDVYRAHQGELEALAEGEDRYRRLVELNVIEQVYNVCKTSEVQQAWKERKLPYVHGWVYDLENGLIKDLQVDIHDDSEIPRFYSYDVDASLD